MCITTIKYPSILSKLSCELTKTLLLVKLYYNFYKTGLQQTFRYSFENKNNCKQKHTLYNCKKKFTLLTGTIVKKKQIPYILEKYC